MVVISHPVHQQAYETVVGAQEAGLLQAFVTSLYMTGRGLSDARLLRPLPPRLRHRVERLQRRRWHPEIEPGRVVTLSRYHAIAMLVRPLQSALGYRGWDRERSPWDAEGWAHDRFDAAVARSLGRVARGARIVHAWEGFAMHTFAAAQRLGLARVLDVTSAFEPNVALIAEAGDRPVAAAHVARVQAERQRADFIFAPSDFVIDTLGAAGVPASKIVKIPYGADPDRFRQTQPSADAERFRVLFAGRVGRRKGVPELLEAWRLADLPGAELILIGDPDSEGAALLASAPPGVRHVPAVPFHEFHRLIQEEGADVFAFPSRAEGSAMVTYIAMSAGLPLITTRNSGSVVEDTEEGLVVPARDPRAIAEALREMHADPGLRTSMGRRARAKIVGGYTWRHYRRRVAAAYRAIAAGTDPQAAVDEAVPR